MGPKKIKILQVNTNRSRLAMDLLEVIAREQRIDIALVSEPNKNMTRNEHWLHDRQQDCAIRLYNKELQATNPKQSNGMVSVDILGARWCSVYLSPNTHITEYQNALDNIENTIRPRGTTTIVAGDINAKGRDTL